MRGIMRAKNLRYLRKKYDETQTELSKQLHIPQSTLSAYETEKVNISDEHAHNIAHHYRITLYEFTYIDLSVEDIASSENGFLPPKNTLFQMMDAWFPVTPPPANCVDTFFIRGYECICSLHTKIQRAQYIDRSDMIDCLQLFQKSWECSKNEGALSNCISIILLLCSSYCSEKNGSELAFIQSLISGKKLNYYEAKKTVLRDNPHDTTQNARTQDRMAFVQEYEDLLMGYLKQLKYSTSFEYRELADFYIACMYTVGFVDNHFPFETNHIMGFNLMAQLYTLDNQYAKHFFSPIMEIIENSDI